MRGWRALVERQSGIPLWALIEAPAAAFFSLSLSLSRQPRGRKAQSASVLTTFPGFPEKADTAALKVGHTNSRS